MGTPATIQTATRGLATVALLKANFDERQDHIGMFEPFVLDSVLHMETDGFAAADAQAATFDRHQLKLPIGVLQTLLRRVVKKGVLRREAGRYFRTGEDQDMEDLRLQRERIEARQALLADALRDSASQRGIEIDSAEAALRLILDFIDRYHVALALDRAAGGAFDAPLDPHDEGGQDSKVVLTAKFLQKTILAGGELADVVQEMLEGFVLQNTLLLSDISAAERHFSDLHVLCDSGFLFGVLGLLGPAVEVAHKELLALLKETGAVLGVFDTTIREMRRVLAVYEDKLGTSEGRRSLYQTDLTRYFLTSHYSPSDVRVQSSLIRTNLRALGFSIRDTPDRMPASTFDEMKLGTMLRSGPGGENDARVVHDIDCVAGALTYRRGRTSESFDSAKAVFLTTSTLTVRNVTRWYREEGGSGVPPIVHYLTLSHVAWIKRPASASGLKMHELVALCSAALRPSRAVWERFLRYLDQLKQSGELSTDEVTAVVASELTEKLLLDDEVADDTDASTLAEVVSRVKQAEHDEMAVEVAHARDSAQRSEAETLRLQMHVERRARALASTATGILASMLIASLVTGAVLGIAHSASGHPPGTLALILAIGPLAFFSLLSVLWGFHVLDWRRRAEERVMKILKYWMSGSR
jgi:hypothetical protein